MSWYTRYPVSGKNYSFNRWDENRLQDSLDQNLLGVIGEHPETTFLLFFPPYSFLAWDELIRAGKFEREIDLQKYTIEQLLAYDNVRLFSFADLFDITSDLSYYKDTKHYREEVNEMMLRCMAEGEHRLSKDNYPDYLESIRESYGNFSYEEFFAKYNM